VLATLAFNYLNPEFAVTKRSPAMALPELWLRGRVIRRMQSCRRVTDVRYIGSGILTFSPHETTCLTSERQLHEADFDNN